MKQGLDHTSGMHGEMRKNVHQSELLLKSYYDIIDNQIQKTTKTVQRNNLVISLIVGCFFLIINFNN